MTNKYFNSKSLFHTYNFNMYHCDALGSPRKMTDESGSVTWSATYYPFGEMTAGSNNTHGFTGKEFDSEMGLNYFCQRYYDPEIGRFMTLDPQDNPAASPYAYCANCPLNFTDPTGEVMMMPLPRGEAGWDGIGYAGWSGSSSWGAHSWADLDPGLFGGPAHDIVSFGGGFYHWDYETGTWTGYGKPFTSPEAFANTLSDLMGGIAAHGEPWWRGNTPLQMADVNAALKWLETNFTFFKDLTDKYNIGFLIVRNIAELRPAWGDSPMQGSYIGNTISIWEYLARECLPRCLGHEIYEIHLIERYGYPKEAYGPAHKLTVKKMRRLFDYSSWWPYF